MSTPLPKRLLLLFITLLFMATLSCGAVSGLNAGDSKGVVAPQNEVPAQPQEQTSGEALTDSGGTATFTVAHAGTEVAVTVIDQQDERPLENIKVTHLSDGIKLLIIIEDPAGKYLPTAREVPLGSSAPVSKRGLAKIAQPAPEQIPLVVLIPLIQIIGVIQNVQAWNSFLADVPEIQNWSEETDELCLNPVQTKEGSQALIGSAAILLSSAGGALGILEGDILLQGLKLVMEQVAQEGVADQVDGMIDGQTPQIVRWKIYKLSGSMPYFIQPEGYCLEPLDNNSVQSAIEWVKYGVEHDDQYVMNLMSADEVGYANYIEGGDRNLKGEFLNDLANRSDSNPTCAGIMDSESNSHSIWFEGWNPPWEMTEACYADCWVIDPPYTSNIVGFFLDDAGDGYRIRTAWINVPDIFQEVYNDQMLPCGTVVTDKSDPVSSGGGQGSTCPGAPKQRMVVGKPGSVCTKEDSIAIRKEPSRSGEMIIRLITGATFKVIDGPECANDWSWWKIQTSNGTTGWIAEGGDDKDPYYICPAD